ncbi:MAG: hypothetical protein KDD83_13015, partial [Caldilineaceae bacterium]|nr:hypothetical protein [Caldilineaceae bacterium]
RETTTTDQVQAVAAAVSITAPLFLLHWGYIQRSLVDDDERRAGMRKFYLYAASTAALVITLVNLHILTSTALEALFAPVQAAAAPLLWLQQIGMVAAGVGLLGYHNHVLQTDGDYGRETGSALLWRRLFLALAGLAGVLMLTLGAAGVVRVLLDFGLERLAPSVGVTWAIPLARGLATVLTGALLTHWAGRQWQTVIALNPDDATSAWRRLYLYGAVVIGAVATLTPAALILREGLLLLFGEEGGSLSLLLNKLISPLAYMPGGMVVWLVYRRTLAREQARFGDSAASITVGRIYNYVVAATALILLWIGSIEILQALIDTGFSRGAVVGARPVWVQPLATGLSLLAVGAPVWIFHWRAAQAVARRDDAAGADERTSLARRIFLFGLALVSAVLVVVFLAQVIYRVFLLLLGAPDAGLWSAEAANELARAAISAAVWLFTVVTIRADGRMPAPAPPAVDRAAYRHELDARIARLEAELAAARAELAVLEDKIEE